MKKKALKKGNIVFWEGDPADCMFSVRVGRLGVYARYATIRQRKIAELTDGDLFGEMGLLEQMPRSATVVVEENGTVLERIGEEEFASYLKESPHKVYALMQQLSHRIRNTNNDYMEVCKALDDAVGHDAEEVDETSDYRFGADARLRNLHDREAASRANA